jgi:hypothetical protein
MTKELLDRGTIKALTLVRKGLAPSDACAATGVDGQHLVCMQDALAGVGDDILHYLAWLRDDTDSLRRRIALHASQRKAALED